MFFQLKKIQALQVRDLATTAFKKSKNVSNSAGTLKIPEVIQNILHHDDGFRILKTLRSFPPYYQTKQKDVFAMINQLGLPTFFATFSAAETRCKTVRTVTEASTLPVMYEERERNMSIWISPPTNEGNFDNKTIFF
jgi:hypothetical protein